VFSYRLPLAPFLLAVGDRLDAGSLIPVTHRASRTIATAPAAQSGQWVECMSFLASDPTVAQKPQCLQQQ
jgi:hypothetical protein